MFRFAPTRLPLPHGRTRLAAGTLAVVALAAPASAAAQDTLPQVQGFAGTASAVEDAVAPVPLHDISAPATLAASWRPSAALPPRTESDPGLFGDGGGLAAAGAALTAMGAAMALLARGRVSLP